MAEPRIPLANRFWAKVQKTDSCWLWTGAKSPDGYGQFKTRHPRQENAHRVAWELTHSKIPDGLQVLHHCDNRSCVRPDHLFLGTQQDNIRDMDAKRRGNRGSGAQNGRAKLNEATVLIIRTRYAAGGVTQQALADQYNVSLTTTWNIIHRKKWQHLPPI